MLEMKGIDTMAIDITDPMQMHMEELKYNKLMVLIGANGTGKSLILKFTWVLSYILSIEVNTKTKGTGVNLKEIAQFIFDNSFDNNNITGTIKAGYEPSKTALGSSIEVTLDNGKITDLKINIEPGVDSMGFPRYMSTNIRLFVNMKPYFKIRSKKGSSAIEECLDLYKLFDLMMMELLIVGYHKVDLNKLNDILKNYDFKEEFILLGFDTDMYGITSDDKKIYFSTYGNGHQSIINMTLTNLI